ncbi:glyoxylate reductase/hydroxypyruvate reductase [Asbolus verrucosus]|uniref:Glyoxylate reductase/hydroxypyruvate reductase n=1 Tax=Asbolus verrucosus TaxID=1661398 RepID=A0A482WC40_ASBVE|nr:glyoxylate reductase/hydroxypyruvate reductase [Asbolus verrucosus]
MARFSVYITREISEEALKLLSTTCDVTSWTGPDPVPRDELLKNIPNKDALFCLLTDKIDKEVLDKANKLKVISTMSVGYDHLDVGEIKKRNIKIGYTPNILTDATAELTIALLLATSRRLLEASEEARKGGWQAWSPFWMCGPGLGGATVGIVGFGRIGQEVAKRIKPFNTKQILYFNRSVRKEANAIGALKVDLDELLTNSDFVIVCCALTSETKGIFNDEAFRKMKKSAVFINTSRGAVVDQDALVRALTNDEIWGAGLDVMTPEPLPLDHPLFKLKNCVILPHIGSACIATRNEMALLTAGNILAALEGKKMPAELEEKSDFTVEDPSTNLTSFENSTIVDEHLNSTISNASDANVTQKLVQCLPNYGSSEVQLVNDTELIKLLLSQTNITTRDVPANCILVLFYSKYCPFSSMAAPHFNALPRAFPDIKMVAINAMVYHLFNTQNGIVGVPTLLLFHNGRPVAKFNESEYTLELFSKFLMKHTGIAAAEKSYVTSADFSGPVTSVPSKDVDVFLIISWLFIIVCGAYYFTKSKCWKWIVETIQSNWRESEAHAQHDHVD